MIGFFPVAAIGTRTIIRRRLHRALVAPLTVLAAVVVLAGCGGGGGSGGGSVPVTPIGPPPVVATASASIVAASGGSVATTLNGETVTLTVPAGALSATATVALTVYAKSGLPRQFASHERRTESLPAGAAYMVGMSVSIGSATLLAPLSFGVTNAATIPAGNFVRLAASRPGGAGFGDVDTATETGTAINESGVPAYAGVSLVGPSILYAFYHLPGADVAPAPSVTLTVAGPASVVGGKTARYTASAVDANGFPFLKQSITWSVGSTALGTIDATTGVFSATTANNVIGQIVGTDRRAAAVGSLPVTVLSPRPANAGDTISYAGTLSSSIANDVIASSPVSSTQSAAVTQTTTVSSSGSGQAVLVANETDDFQLSTLTTKTSSTLAFEPSGTSTVVRLLTTTATDSNNATYTTAYTPSSGLLARLPEVPGDIGPNDASQTYSETDPGINVGAGGQSVTTVRSTASNGAYNETTTNADGSTDVAVANADGSGVYTIESFLQFTFGAAQAAPSREIPITLATAQDGTYVTTQTAAAPVWYPLPLALYTEVDTVASAHAYDPRCNVPAKYGTTSAVVKQTITSIDPVYGNLENQTSTAYDVIGVGTVCSIFTDSTQTFYDFTGQEGLSLEVGGATAPVLVANTTEVLSITAATISGQPVSTQSRERSAATLSRLAVFVGRERFEHAVRQAKIAQAVRMARYARRMKGAR